MDAVMLLFHITQMLALRLECCWNHGRVLWSRPYLRKL